MIKSPIVFKSILLNWTKNILMKIDITAFPLTFVNGGNVSDSENF